MTQMRACWCYDKKAVENNIALVIYFLSVAIIACCFMQYRRRYRRPTNDKCLLFAWTHFKLQAFHCTRDKAKISCPVFTSLIFFWSNWLIKQEIAIVNKTRHLQRNVKTLKLTKFSSLKSLTSCTTSSLCKDKYAIKIRYGDFKFE